MRFDLLRRIHNTACRLSDLCVGTCLPHGNKSSTMYKHLISQFTGFSVLVIGDLMLDVYLKGASTRLAPEAAVPIVDILNTETALGGAANVAANLKHLGACVTFCSVTGKDKDGYSSIELLSGLGVNCMVQKDESRITIVKTRIMVGTQLMVRYDSGSVHPISETAENWLISILEEHYPQYDAIIVADYNKGVITPAVIDALKVLNLRYGKFMAIDSKRLECFKHLSPSLVKPNYQEIVKLLRLDSQYNQRAQQISSFGRQIFSLTRGVITAVTLDEEGAVIFSGEELSYRCCAHRTIPTHVAGAGDSYVSAFTLACLAGADIATAAEISAAVAAVAISKNTTAYCTYRELNTYLSVNEKYITDLQQLEHICAMYKAQGKTIVFTNGCFDILHSGHVNYLNRARELGHVLIAGINTDESIRRIKGSFRPINYLQDRIEVLCGLGAITHIVSFGSEADDTPAPLIRVVRPDIFVKGGDYTEETLPEGPLVEELGGKIILLPLLPDKSTTRILDRIQANHPQN